MQFIWKYIDDLAGKGLEVHILAELILYASASLVPMALPLAILLSSIMTFGSMAENLELVACKASGISLLKIMRPLVLLMFFNAAFAFYFSNYVMPVAGLKMRSLILDIQRQRPAIDIKPGVFYDGLKGLVIRIDEVAKNKQDLKGVIVYDHTEHNTGNARMTMAESGKIEITPDERFLIFKLTNGIMYDETGFFTRRDPGFPHIRNKFKEQIFLVDLSDFKLSRKSEGIYKDHYTMLNVKQLDDAVDVMEKDFVQRVKDYGKFMKKNYFFARKNPQQVENPFAGDDSAKAHMMKFLPHQENSNQVSGKAQNEVIHVISNTDNSTVLVNLKDLISPMPLKRLSKQRQEQVIESALNVTRGNRQRCKDFEDEIIFRKENIAKHEAEWHRKFTLSVACIVLFFVGAPLGAIIKKGGLGLPLVASILIFILYYVISTIGEKAVKQLTMGPIEGMWLSTIILIPFGIFLTIKASNDSQLFSSEAYYRIWAKLFKPKKAVN